MAAWAPLPSWEIDLLAGESRRSTMKRYNPPGTRVDLPDSKRIKGYHALIYGDVRF